jgi:hypothetical protein
MRYIRRYHTDRAIIAPLTVWRRLLLASVLIFAANDIRGAAGMLCAVVAFGVLLSAAHVFWLKLRMTAWP